MPPRYPSRSSFLLAAILVFAAIAVFPAYAAAPPPAPSGAIDQAFLWRSFLAPFHAVVLHFPIGFVTMVFVLEVYRFFRPGAEVRNVTTLTLWLSLMSGGVTAFLGILRATEGGYQSSNLESHRWTGMAVVGCMLLTLAMQRLAYRNETRRTLTYAYRASLAATLGLLVVAGHMGGNLTHGSQYLTENAPSFIRTIMGEEAAAPMVTTVAGLDERQRFFAEEVQPIFEKRCVRCHGPEKQKGAYRLDQAETALKGGESGSPAIVPGDPMASELVRLILLPPDDDAIMPPAGKEPVTAEEMLTIIRWIQNGAHFPTPAVASVEKTSPR